MQRASIDALESFVTLARTQRMRETTRLRGVTRHTVLRHVEAVEKSFGKNLIFTEGHTYKLTSAGNNVLQKIEELLGHAHSVFGGYEYKNEIVNGLNRTIFHSEIGGQYYSQQHPLWRIWVDAPSLLQHTLEAWIKSRFHIEEPPLKHIMPYLLLFRYTEQGWLCTHVGEKSTYSRWFGWDWAKSAIGTLSTKDPVGVDYDRFASFPYEAIYQTGSARFDHHFVKLISAPGGDPRYIRYQRLLMCCLLPDDSPIIGTIGILTNEIDMPNVKLTKENEMDEAFLMDFEAFQD